MVQTPRSLLFLCISICVCFAACENSNSGSAELNATAEIIIEGPSPYRVNDTLRFLVTEYAHKDDEEVDAINFHWFISDASGIVLENDFESAKNIIWIPEEIGAFMLGVKVGYPDTTIVAEPIHFDVYQQDLRKPYIGEYRFKRIIYAWVQMDSALRVSRDTTYFNGKVEPLDGIGNVDKIRIICGNGEETLLGTFNMTWEESFLAHLIFPLDNLHPHFVIYDDGFHSRFRGEFINPDSLDIVKQGGGLGGGRDWRYYGSKTN